MTLTDTRVSSACTDEDAPALTSDTPTVIPVRASARSRAPPRAPERPRAPSRASARPRAHTRACARHRASPRASARHRAPPRALAALAAMAALRVLSQNGGALSQNGYVAQTVQNIVEVVAVAGLGYRRVLGAPRGAVGISTWQPLGLGTAPHLRIGVRVVE